MGTFQKKILIKIQNLRLFFKFERFKNFFAEKFFLFWMQKIKENFISFRNIFSKNKKHLNWSNNTVKTKNCNLYLNLLQRARWKYSYIIILEIKIKQKHLEKIWNVDDIPKLKTTQKGVIFNICLWLCKKKLCWFQNFLVESRTNWLIRLSYRNSGNCKAIVILKKKKKLATILTDNTPLKISYFVLCFSTLKP